MAEIKSTMDMVMERAARMAAAAPTTSDDEALVKKGMRLAADYVNGKEVDLQGELAALPGKEQAEVAGGMMQTLLRNVVLPRSKELQETGELALRGVLLLAGKKGEVVSICRELDQILKQYDQHKEQMTKQLEEAIRAQLEQQGGGRGQAGGRAPVNPALHPQYRDELARMLSGLNAQYTEAMDQRKAMVLRLFTAAAR